MAYYIYNAAIRWKNGDLEGFSAWGLTEVEARSRAIRKAVKKSHEMGISGEFIHLNGAQYKNLSIEEQDSLQSDWNGSTI